MRIVSFVVLFSIATGLLVVVDGLTYTSTLEFIIPSPMPWAYAHACSLAQLADGTIVSVFHAGNGEDQPDSTVYVSRRDPATGVWSPPNVALNTPGVCDANPSLMLANNGVLHMFAHTGSLDHTDGRCSTHTWSGLQAFSADGGVTWAAPKPLPHGYLGGIKNKCITLSNSDILCPSSTESVAIILGVWMSHFETYRLSPNTPDYLEPVHKSNSIQFYFSSSHKKVCQGDIQPTLFEDPTSPGRVYALLRTSCGTLASAVSHDFGKTWPTFASDADIDNPGAGVDGTVTKDTSLGWLLFGNDNVDHRTPLNMWHSLDQGGSWELIAAPLESDPQGRFSYPAVVPAVNENKVFHSCYSFESKGMHTMAYRRVQFD